MNAVQKGTAACVLQSCALGVTLFFGTAASAGAAEAPSCNPARIASLDARMTAKADQGTAQLGRFVRQVGVVYQLDYATAVSRVERFRRDRASCDAMLAVK